MNIHFNLYGLIIGISLVVAAHLIEIQLKKYSISEKIFYRVAVFACIGAVIGARVWHVATDFYLYADSLADVWKIWNGGLSIFGGVLGGVIGLSMSFFIFPELRLLSLQKQKKLVLSFLDAAIFGLPIGQAIGRLGNYFNQELYGKPTNGTLKIYIDELHRLPNYKSIEYYHPLFLYEMIGTGLFAGVLYLLHKKTPIQIGSGNLFVFYIFYYSILRFFLDFLRLDKNTVFSTQLGINQVVLLGVIGSIFIYYLSHLSRILYSNAKQ